jgi:adenine-specific DNA methylase
VEAKGTCALQIPSFLQTVNNAHFKLIFIGYNEEDAAMQKNQITNDKSVCTRKNAVSLKWATIKE